jgi:hypothetical protein
MKKNDLMSVTLVAVGTATLTVAAFLANPLEAGSGASAPATPIATPKLVAGGLELSLVPAPGRVFQAGDQPAFELRAVNTRPEAATVKVCVTLRASDPAGLISRVVRVPAVFWREEQVLTLGANESQTTAVLVRTNLPANRLISVLLSQAVPEETPAAAGGFLPNTPEPRLGMASAENPAAPRPAILALTFSTAPPKPAPALAVH